jgi:hypothetical protein
LSKFYSTIDDFLIVCLFSAHPISWINAVCTNVMLQRLYLEKCSLFFWRLFNPFFRVVCAKFFLSPASKICLNFEKEWGVCLKLRKYEIVVTNLESTRKCFKSWENTKEYTQSWASVHKCTKEVCKSCESLRKCAINISKEKFLLITSSVKCRE